MKSELDINVYNFEKWLFKIVETTKWNEMPAGPIFLKNTNKICFLKDKTQENKNDFLNVWKIIFLEDLNWAGDKQSRILPPHH